MSQTRDLPFSHVRRIDELSSTGTAVRLSATEAERKAIARLMGILSVEALDADLLAVREGDRVRVTGHITGRARQACVVSLDPVEEAIDAEVEIVFAPKEEAEALMRKAGLPDPDAVDPDKLDAIAMASIDLAAIDLAMLNDPDALPEPITDGGIDFGHIAYDTLALELDPYPRKSGVVFEAPAEPEGFGNPFAVLKGLKPKT
ncbi:MAG: DUF177 domain-containing protein [Beijerinckiaceae bacterium]|nr:DUF177 domain-containing protein [Beijerinckiaceae bacterium]